MIYTILVAIPCQEIHKVYLERTGGEHCRFIFCPEFYGNWPTYTETKWMEILEISFGIKKEESIKEIGKEEILSSDHIDFLKKADVIIGEPPFTLVKALSKRRENPLKWIQMSWAGTDIYTQNVGFPEKVKLTNMSGAFGTIIAEYVMGAVLYFYRNFPIYKKQQKLHLWKDFGEEDSLEGKRILILGAGDIGTQVAKRMKAFDAFVVGFRRNIVDKPENFDEICGQKQLQKEIRLADVVIGCLPHSKETTHLLGEAEFAAMKEQAVFVNVGRGSLVETKALEKTLKKGKLRGVALDVTTPEPLPKSSVLWNIDRVLITPHIAGPSFGHSKRTEEKIIQLCAENIKRFVKKEPLKNIIFIKYKY